MNVDDTTPEFLYDKTKLKTMKKVFELVDKGNNVEVRKAPKGQGYKVATINKHTYDIEVE